MTGSIRDKTPGAMESRIGGNVYSAIASGGAARLSHVPDRFGARVGGEGAPTAAQFQRGCTICPPRRCRCGSGEIHSEVLRTEKHAAELVIDKSVAIQSMA